MPVPERGVVVVDKPSGPTSHEVAAWVADVLGAEKAAHTGTLDPRVTGCLPVLFGPAARASGMFAETPKEYVFVLELHGSATPERLRGLFDEFEGRIYQRPPVRGSANRELRTREIHELTLLETDDPNRALGHVRCESGTYVRKLCHDLGLALGVGGHMAELRRERSGSSTVEGACYLQDLADAVAVSGDEPRRLDELVVPLADALGALGLPSVVAEASATESLSHGAPLFAPGVVTVDEEAQKGETVFVTADGEAVAVGTFEGEGAEPVVRTEKVLV